MMCMELHAHLNIGDYVKHNKPIWYLLAIY